MSKLAKLIAKMEGFGIPGAVPTTHHNPGDLRHSPHSQHDPGSPERIGKIDTDEHGWEDLERQLEIYAKRGLNVAQLITVYAPPNENDTQRYLDFITHGLNCLPETKLTDAITL